MCRPVLNTGNTESDFGGTFNCSEPWFPFWEAGITTVSFVVHMMWDDRCQLISVVCVIKDQLPMTVLNYVSLLLIVSVPEALPEPLPFLVVTRQYWRLRNWDSMHRFTGYALGVFSNGVYRKDPWPQRWRSCRLPPQIVHEGYCNAATFITLCTVCASSLQLQR